MYLREIAVYADENIVTRFPSSFVGWFHRETCCVTEFYESLIYRKMMTRDTAKVNLVFFDEQGLVPRVRQLINVADARWAFDFAAYAEKDEPGKKRMILDALHAALLWIAKDRAWETEALNNAYSQIVNRNMAFENFSRKTWFSQNRKFKAKVGFSYGLRTIQFFVVLYDKKGGELGRKPLGEVAPEMGVIHWVLKQKAVWNARNVFRLNTEGYCFHLPRKMEVGLSDLLA